MECGPTATDFSVCAPRAIKLSSIDHCFGRPSRVRAPWWARAPCSRLTCARANLLLQPRTRVPRQARSRALPHALKPAIGLLAHPSRRRCSPRPAAPTAAPTLHPCIDSRCQFICRNGRLSHARVPRGSTQIRIDPTGWIEARERSSSGPWTSRMSMGAVGAAITLPTSTVNRLLPGTARARAPRAACWGRQSEIILEITPEISP